MTTTTLQTPSTPWRVWLGAYASLWSHRGYEVRGESVYCETRQDAERLALEIVGADAVAVPGGDGTYYYADDEAALRDSDGSRASAVVCSVEAE